MASRISERLATSAEFIEGGGGVFDVHVNGELVYSKHQTGKFPDEERLVEELARTHT